MRAGQGHLSTVERVPRPGCPVASQSRVWTGAAVGSPDPRPDQPCRLPSRPCWPRTRGCGWGRRPGGCRRFTAPAPQAAGAACRRPGLPPSAPRGARCLDPKESNSAACPMTGSGLCRRRTQREVLESRLDCRGTTSSSRSSKACLVADFPPVAVICITLPISIPRQQTSSDCGFAGSSVMVAGHGRVEKAVRASWVSCRRRPV